MKPYLVTAPDGAQHVVYQARDGRIRSLRVPDQAGVVDLVAAQSEVCCGCR